MRCAQQFELLDAFHVGVDKLVHGKNDEKRDELVVEQDQGHCQAEHEGLPMLCQHGQINIKMGSKTG
jgi:hypothetical protein